MIALPPDAEVERVVATALAEDLGHAGDLTSGAVVPASAGMTAAVTARETGVVAGLPFTARVFSMVDPAVTVEASSTDGNRVEPGTVVMRVRGDARSVLTAERTALNLLGRLSGVASLTRRFVEAVAGTRAHITDTRKTTPGLRSLEKYAVRAGGGTNHRFGLHDMVLVKDNHIAAAGGLAAVLAAVRARPSHAIRVEIEVDSLDQLEQLLADPAGVDAVMLDNFPIRDLEEAVRLIDGRLTIEASGGVDLSTVAAIAATGVDLISVGALTHSAVQIDFGLDAG